MSWGDALVSAYNAATDAARQAGASMMSSAASAANAVSRAADAAAAAAARTAQAAAQAATRAAVATRDAAVAAATATSRAVTSAATATRDAAVQGARMAGNAATFGGRAVVDAAGITGGAATGVATAPYRAARNLLAPAATPAQTLVEPCPDTWAGKKARLEKRRQMIRDGQRSSDPAVRTAADRFQQNNEAVELARLSNDAYAQIPPKDPPSAPPVGWSMMSADELHAHRIDPEMMNQARAVMYQTPDDWPGGKQTVLAFRGTADLEDGIVDHDQAMALETKQYQAAVLLGNDVSERMGEGVLVTGHSLGGGKAQAAGAAGGLKGTMFNAAGLHPDTVNGKMPQPDQFTQYRTTGDPLTGTQNSPAAQAAIVGIVGPLAGAFGGGMKAGDAIGKFFGGSGLSPDVADHADKAFKALPRSLRNVLQNGDVMPPAIGPIHQVETINAAGEVVSRANLAGQHSIVSAINGIEKEKTEDMAVLAAH